MPFYFFGGNDQCPPYLSFAMSKCFKFNNTDTKEQQETEIDKINRIARKPKHLRKFIEYLATTGQIKDDTNEEQILVAGITIEKFYYPKLYEWGKNHPETLEAQLRSIADKWHEGDLRCAANALESDLKG